MLDFIIRLGGQRRYWVALILIGITLEAAALYYQYVLDEWPCVLCIHVRLWLAAMVLLALFALFCTPSATAMKVLHALNVAILAILVERSWRVLAIERGWIFGECDMDLGTPDWFAPDRWLPFLFEVQTTCGYSPLIVFNITMAELLLLISGLMLVGGAAVFAARWLE